MGSTITAGRAAAGVRTYDGRTLFALFEETYSSNTYPHIPEWCCMGLGHLPATMQCIFDLASNCEGGMLRNRSGRLTPEGYIGTWLKELADPLVMHRTDVHLDVGDGWQAAITKTKLDVAVDLLTKAGLAAQAAKLRDKQSVTLDLVHDADALLTLQAGLDISPWRFISAHAVDQRSGQRDPTLGHAPEAGRASTLDVPTALKLGTDVRLLQKPDGTWRCGGWQHALVGKHVRDLWQVELACPGHHRKRIAAFRNAFNGAPQAPAGLMVEIDETKTDDAYYLQRIKDLRQQAGGTDRVFRVPVTKGNEYALTNLPRDCATWLLPDHHQTPPTRQAALIL